MKGKNITYKDENGDILLGYSVRDQERTIFWLKMLVLLGAGFLFLFLFLISYSIHYKVLGNVLKALAGGF